MLFTREGFRSWSAMRPRIGFSWLLLPKTDAGMPTHSLKCGDCRTKQPLNGTSRLLRLSTFAVLRHFVRDFAACTPPWIIRGRSKFEKELDTGPASHLASPLPLRLHRSWKQLHFIHEKKINFTISLL
jgi:hypothetical protein